MNVMFASLVVLVAIATASSALPAAEWEPLPEPQEQFPFDDVASLLPPQQEERSPRLARATCDLLSFSTPWGQANHSICAAHCLSMRRGFRGGRCIKGVCNCRK